VHLAACFEDNDKVKNSSGYDVSRVNAEGTANLAEAVSRGNLKHFILASSISVYDGLMTSDVINESTTARPDNAYGRSKVESERIVCETASVSGFKATILRIPFVYGPGNKRNIYRMIQAVDRGRFFMIGSGQNSRSAVYVGNLVDAISLVLNDEGCHSGLYIVTDNKDYTLMEIYSAIAEALGKTPSKIFIPKNLGKFCARILDVLEKITGRTFCFDSDIYKRLTRTFRFSCEKIRRELGYIPKKDLYSAIDETIEWYKKTGK
jgi:nucleoside-diphosphate-sugar epimerase